VTRGSLGGDGTQGGQDSRTANRQDPEKARGHDPWLRVVGPTGWSPPGLSRTVVSRGTQKAASDRGSCLRDHKPRNLRSFGPLVSMFPGMRARLAVFCAPTVAPRAAEGRVALRKLFDLPHKVGIALDVLCKRRRARHRPALQNVSRGLRDRTGAATCVCRSACPAGAPALKAVSDSSLPTSSRRSASSALRGRQTAPCDCCRT
jgi:hypothetical protein